MPNNIRSILHSQQLTYGDVAHHLNVSPVTVRGWCDGKQMHTRYQWQLARLLGVTVDEMLGEWE